MEIELVSECLGDRDHTGAKVLLLAGHHGHQLADGLPGRGAERAEELPMMHEAGAKELRDGEHPLGVADVGDDLVLEQGARSVSRSACRSEVTAGGRVQRARTKKTSKDCCSTAWK